MKIYAVDSKKLSLEELALIESLQGLVNRHTKETGVGLYIDAENYMVYLKKYKVIYLTFDEAIIEFKEYIKGIVLFDITPGNISINTACNMATIYDAVMVDYKLFKVISKYNFKELFDTKELNGDFIDQQKYIFDNYKHLFNNNALVHQVTKKDCHHIRLRDYAIKNKWMCLYTGEDKKSFEFREEVLKWLESNSPIYGWTSDEISFVDHISQYGNYVCPADWSLNHSLLDEIDADIPKQPSMKADEIDNINKYHYVTIVCSDGDNIQWLERDFATSSSFGERIKTEQNFPMSFTISPTLADVSPIVLEYIYKQGKNNYFVSGVSGVGYMNPCNYPKNHLKNFCDKTAKFMSICDLNIVTLLDNLKNLYHVTEVLDEYAKHDNIYGGIYELDPTMYGGGNGKIYWSSNGKPFASVRETMWAPDGTNKTVTEEWLTGIADRINNYKVDPTSEDGYTVLNYHPWSMKIENLERLVKKLDSHVKIISTNKFIELVKNNVKH